MAMMLAEKAPEADPGAVEGIVEQIGGWGIIGIIVGVVILLVVLKIIFSVIRTVIRVVVTLALVGALGGGFLGIANGWFDKTPEFFQTIFDNMPWS